LDDRRRELTDIACGLADLAERLVVLVEPAEALTPEGLQWLAEAQAELDVFIRSVES
jgi:hypothetical protein